MDTFNRIDGGSCCPGGRLLLVRNPSVASDRKVVEVDVADTVKNILCEVGEADTKIRGCTFGSSHSLVKVDNGKGIITSAEPKLEASFTEISSLTITGKRLPPYHTLLGVCTNISQNLSCAYDDSMCSLTISGFWDDVQEARERIHMLIMETATQKTEKSEYSEEASNPDVHSPAHPTPQPALSTSCYESIGVVPHVIKMTKHRHGDLGPGISHKEGSSTVHFRFNSERELDTAIEKFQKEIEMLEESIKTERVKVPRGIHKDEQFAIIVSDLEDMYEDTMITWLDGEVEIEVISTRTDEVTHDLEEMMQQVKADDYQRVPDKGPSTGEKSGGFLKGLGNFFTSSPKIAYRSQVELNFPMGRKFVLRHGNLLHENVDAIINPANQFLSHGAGLAKQIDKASKGSITRYSNEELSRIGGRVPTGSVVTTKSGNGDLHCYHVIHAVGPNAHEIRSGTECVGLLKKTIHEITKEGCRLKCQSIAIPAISSGLFGMKKETVAETIIHVLVDYQQSQHTHDYLRDIRVVIWDRDTYDPFYIVTCGIESSLKLH